MYRSDALSRLAEEDWRRVGELGIGIVADLRNDRERARWPSAWPDHWQLEFLQRDYDFDFQAGPARSGYHSLAYQQADTYRRFFQRLAQPDAPPVLIHCTAGQDRTGFACAFLLAVLEVPDDTILEDYSLSHALRRELAFDPEHADELITFYGLDRTVEEMVAEKDISTEDLRARAKRRLARALERIAEDHGSVQAFVERELHVDEDTAERLRDELLTND